ncbi:MAG: hypothetical protein J6R03_05985 [Treponema sp.]|nr:hypothetical protein [Treponema sp.]
MGFKDFFIKDTVWVNDSKTGRSVNWKGKTLYNVNTTGKSLSSAIFDHINSSGEGKLVSKPSPFWFTELKK